MVRVSTRALCNPRVKQSFLEIMANSYLFRDTVLKLIESANLEYKNLTGQKAEPAA